MTRLEAFAERVTREMLSHIPPGDAYDDQDEVRARAVLEREVKALAREIDCDIQGPAQSYLDEPVTK